MTADHSDDNDKVGKCKPPVHSRWKPGQCGNPRGRPKGALNLKTEAKLMIEAPVVVNDKGKPKRITTLRAVQFRLREGALKGNFRCMTFFSNKPLGCTGAWLRSHLATSPKTIRPFSTPTGMKSEPRQPRTIPGRATMTARIRNERTTFCAATHRIALLHQEGLQHRSARHNVSSELAHRRHHP